MMSSLEFIKMHSSCWFGDSHDRVQMIYGGNNYGAIHFWSTKSSECFMSHFFDDCDESFNDNKVWTREEFEAYSLDSKKPPVSTGNRDIERGTIDAVLSERGSRYGKFKDGADIMQELKAVMRSTNGWRNLSASQKEALEMMQHKIGRILNGDPNYIDNFIDICGYSKLIADELKGDSK